MTDHSAPRTVIRGGTILDGSGQPAFRADLLLEDGRIAAVIRGETPHCLDARSIDAHGFAVSPGFIDLHSHSDITVLAFPSADSAVHQGVTTVVNGNCGLGPAPRTPHRDFRRVTIAYEPDWEVDVDWSSVGEYMSRTQGAAVNTSALVPHGAVRNAVMGLERRAPTSVELADMTQIIDEAMSAGALGVSTGLEYHPGCFAELEELVAIATAAGRRGGVYVSHIRNRGDRFGAAVLEAAEIARRSGARLQLSHFAPRPYAPRDETESAYSTVEALHDEGHPVGVDTFPEIWGPGRLLDLLPDDVGAGTPTEVLARLSDSAIRTRIRDHFTSGDNFLARAAGYEQIFLTSSPADPAFTGHSIVELADSAGTDLGTWTCDALLAAGPIFATIGIRHIYATEQDLRELMLRSDCSLGSDGVVSSGEGSSCASPWNASSYGYTARLLGHYARDEGLFTLEEAVRRLTALPAEAVGLNDRGLIAEGMASDLVVFDPEGIIDRTTPDDIARHPEGIHHVLVGGIPVVENGRTTDARPGTALTLGGAR